MVLFDLLTNYELTSSVFGKKNTENIFSRINVEELQHLKAETAQALNRRGFMRSTSLHLPTLIDLEKEPNLMLRNAISETNSPEIYEQQIQYIEELKSEAQYFKLESDLAYEASDDINSHLEHGYWLLHNIRQTSSKFYLECNGDWEVIRDHAKQDELSTVYFDIRETCATLLMDPEIQNSESLLIICSECNRSFSMNRPYDFKVGNTSVMSNQKCIFCGSCEIHFPRILEYYEELVANHDTHHI